MFGSIWRQILALVTLFFAFWVAALAPALELISVTQALLEDSLRAGGLGPQS
jgi:hypothetical protein